MGQAKRHGSYAERRAQALQAREPERTHLGLHHRRTVTHPRRTVLAALLAQRRRISDAPPSGPG